MHDIRGHVLGLVLLLVTASAAAASTDAEHADRGSDLAYRRAIAPSPDARRLNADSTARVRRIANRLIVSAASIDADAKRFGWAFNLVPSLVPDVRTYPGGRLIATDGLTDRAGLADDEIAAVIAYAVAHTVLRHDAARVVAPARNESGDPNRLTLDYADAVTTAMRDVRYTPTEIAAADRMSVEILARAAYDPRSTVNAWRRLGSAGQGIVERSPVSEERIAALETSIRAAVPLYEETRARAEAYSRAQRPRPQPRVTGQPQRDPVAR